MSFWFPYLQYWLIGWPVLWYLISCVMQIKWHWFPQKRKLHLPQVQLSYLESGHTQALSHYRLGIQSHTSDISSTSFQSVIWNVQGSIRDAVVDHNKVWRNSHYKYWPWRHVGYPEFSWFEWGVDLQCHLPGWQHSKRQASGLCLWLNTVSTNREELSIWVPGFHTCNCWLIGWPVV